MGVGTVIIWTGTEGEGERERGWRREDKLKRGTGTGLETRE